MAVRAYQLRGVARGAAPALAARTIDGAPVSLAAYRGRPVLVHVWATWCGVCKAMSSNVAAYAADHEVLSIATDSGDADTLRAALDRHGMTDLLDAPKLELVADPSGHLAQRLGVHVLPTDFFIDPGGTIRWIESGYTTELGLRARALLASR